MRIFDQWELFGDNGLYMVENDGRKGDGATVWRCDGATVRRCDGATVRRCDGATVRRYDGVTVRWCNVGWHYHHRTVIPLYRHTLNY